MLTRTRGRCWCGDVTVAFFSPRASAERTRRSGRQHSVSTRRMVALYDYDPRESSPNIDVEVPACPSPPLPTVSPGTVLRGGSSLLWNPPRWPRSSKCLRRGEGQPSDRLGAVCDPDPVVRAQWCHPEGGREGPQWRCREARCAQDRQGWVTLAHPHHGKDWPLERSGVPAELLSQGTGCVWTPSLWTSGTPESLAHGRIRRALPGSSHTGSLSPFGRDPLPQSRV